MNPSFITFALLGISLLFGLGIITFQEKNASGDQPE
jgi:hypothetical protein